jgi:hypothetical protein
MQGSQELASGSPGTHWSCEHAGVAPQRPSLQVFVQQSEPTEQA